MAEIDDARLEAEFEKLAAMTAAWPQSATLTPLENLAMAAQVFHEWGFCGEMAAYLQAYLAAPESERLKCLDLAGDGHGPHREGEA